MWVLCVFVFVYAAMSRWDSLMAAREELGIFKARVKR